MLGKKGDFGFPLYFIQSFAVFILVLLFFGALFFFIGVFKNPHLIINADSYSDSSKLLTLLQTQENDTKLTITELIPLSFNNQEYKQKLTEELNKFISDLPKPENKQAYWNLDIYSNEVIFISLGDKTLGAKDHYIQKITLPSLSKENFKISLYLNCLTCTKEDIEKYA